MPPSGPSRRATGCERGRVKAARETLRAPEGEADEGLVRPRIQPIPIRPRKATDPNEIHAHRSRIITNSICRKDARPRAASQPPRLPDRGRCNSTDPETTRPELHGAGATGETPARVRGQSRSSYSGLKITRRHPSPLSTPLATRFRPG